jgi:hypothetical protein
VILHDKITRLRAPLASGGYGNQARDWANANATSFAVHWSAQSAGETVGDEPRTTTRVKLLGDQYLDLEATDRVIGPDGNTYQVDGEILPSYRRGQLHHVRAFLRRIATKD